MIIDRARCPDGGQYLLVIFEMVPVRHTRCAIGQDAHQSAACIKANPLAPLARGVRGFLVEVAARLLNKVA
jgi:hypothetical protein